MIKLLSLILLLLAGCNSVYLKPNSIVPDQVVFADRGGYSMRRSIKQQLESRGYKVVVGRAKSSKTFSSDTVSIDLETVELPKDVRYVVKVAERRERFNPFWCPLNGFWWWNFNVSIADQQTGEELMTWRGRGCANSSLRKLDNILNRMEIKE